MKEYLSNTPVEEISEKQIDFYSKWLVEQNALNSLSVNEPRIFNDVFEQNNVLAISGLRLFPAVGFKDHLGVDQSSKILKENIARLTNAGIDGVVLESYMDRPHKMFYDDKSLLDYYLNLALLAKDESKGKLKVGINFILFDIYGALSIAKLANLDFVVVDEFVNHVECSKEEADYDHSFIFNPNPSKVKNFQNHINAKNILILAGTHSNYYPPVEPVDFHTSVEKAHANSASAIVMGKGNADLYNLSDNHKIPILVSGGIKYEDIDWIKKNKFRGFLAGSLFEEKFGFIDPLKVEAVMNTVK